MESFVLRRQLLLPSISLYVIQSNHRYVYLHTNLDHLKHNFLFRTYVRNAYTYHLSEIFFTIVNEYTDWERTVQVCLGQGIYKKLVKIKIEIK